jgi:hypothetical protein
MQTLGTLLLIFNAISALAQALVDYDQHLFHSAGTG